MKKLIALILSLTFVLALSGCTNKVDFSDFSDYEKDFKAVAQFVIEYDYQRNDATTFIVDINDDSIKIDEVFQSPGSLRASIKRISEKGFSYIEVGKDYMIFWENETGYYGVLWSENPREAIQHIIKESRPQMKFRKLSDKWYEVGALDSI